MKKNRLLPFICSLALSIAIVFIYILIFANPPKNPVYHLDSGWEVTINDDIYRDVNLMRFSAETDRNLYLDDHVIMTLTLPEEGETPLTFPVILFRSRYTTLRCYVDDTLIYDFGFPDYENEEFIGKSYHIISLPEDYQGKEFKMDMLCSENNPFNSLAPPILGSQPDVEGTFIHENLNIILTGIFLLMFGIAFLLITVTFVSHMREISSLIVGSLMCINIGVWLLAYYNVVSPFMYAPRETALEYFTLYLIVPFCFAMVYCIQNIDNKKLFIAAWIACSAVTLFQYILHYMFNIHMRVTLPLYHVVCVFGFVILLYFTRKNIIKKDISTSAHIQMLGLLAFAIAEIIHLIIYNTDTMHYTGTNKFSIIVISMGCMFFALSQLINYLMYITRSYAQKMEYASLTHLAYADGLTNLANRASADRELQALNEQTEDYCIISIDLNGLKYVNDKFGHPSGDKYIKDFSKVLVTTFGDYGL